MARCGRRRTCRAAAGAAGRQWRAAAVEPGVPTSQAVLAGGAAVAWVPGRAAGTVAGRVAHRPVVRAAGRQLFALAVMTVGRPGAAAALAERGSALRDRKPRPHRGNRAGSAPRHYN